MLSNNYLCKLLYLKSLKNSIATPTYNEMFLLQISDISLAINDIRAILLRCRVIKFIRFPYGILSHQGVYFD